MPTLPGATPQQQKVYDFLHSGGFLNENKLQDTDKIALGVKLPKGIVAQALLDLEKKGFVKRVARGKAAGYYVTINFIGNKIFRPLTRSSLSTSSTARPIATERLEPSPLRVIAVPAGAMFGRAVT